MGMVDSVLTLVILRLFQGALTGTVTAAQIMVAANTPTQRVGTALGALSAAVATGGMAGAALGGVLAHLTNFRIPFLVAGGIQALTFLVVLIGTREAFARKPLKSRISVQRMRVRVRQLSLALPVLLLIAWVAMVKKFDQAFLPLLVQDINGSLDGVSLWAGAVNGLGGVAGLVAGITLGLAADRVSPARLARWSCMGAGLFMLCQAFATTFLALLPLRFGMLLFDGGLDPAMQAWLAKTTPPERRGLVFGWAGSARAVGFMLAPLLSGLVATGLGIRPVFVVGAVLFAALIPVISWVIRRGAGTPAGANHELYRDGL
jgi:DHA1 family multidrug resistance protein-like MFS transporter